jgi:adenylate kinase
VSGIDDETGDALVQRDDDLEETVRKRLAVYQEQTRPLVKFYSGMTGESAPAYHFIAGVGNVQEIRAKVVDALAS